MIYYLRRLNGGQFNFDFTLIYKLLFKKVSPGITKAPFPVGLSQKVDLKF
jgi:hypothetical protein